MVVVFVMTLFLAFLSVGLWAYSRTLLTSAAAHAARYAANADVVDAGSIAAHTSEELTHSFAASTADTVICEALEPTGDVPLASGDPTGARPGVPQHADDVMIGISCTMEAPGLLPFLDGILPDLSVTAHTVREGR